MCEEGELFDSLGKSIALLCTADLVYDSSISKEISHMCVCMADLLL